jgi:hypothetical protein
MPFSFDANPRLLAGGVNAESHKDVPGATVSYLLLARGNSRTRPSVAPCLPNARKYHF